MNLDRDLLVNNAQRLWDACGHRLGVWDDEYQRHAKAALRGERLKQVDNPLCARSPFDFLALAYKAIAQTPSVGSTDLTSQIITFQGGVQAILTTDIPEPIKASLSRLGDALTNTLSVLTTLPDSDRKARLEQLQRDVAVGG